MARVGSMKINGPSTVIGNRKSEQSQKETTPVGFSLMELRGEEQLSNALSPILCPNMASAICSMKPSRS